MAALTPAAAGAADGRLRALVINLMATMGVRESAAPFVEFLAQNVSAFELRPTSVATVKRKLAERATVPTAFLAKYDELERRRVPNLDRFMCLISKIVDNDELKAILCRPSLSSARVTEPAPVPVSAPAPAPAPAAAPAHAPVLFKRGPSVPLPDPEDETGAEPRRTSPVRSSHPASYVLSPGSAAALESVRTSSSVILPLRESSASNAVPAPAPGPSGAPEPGTLPLQPDWVLRPFLKGQYVVHDGAEGSRDDARVSLEGKASAVQDMCLVEDLLHALMGIEGTYVWAYAREGGYAFQVHVTAIDPSIADLVSRILPLADSYVTVQQFVDERSRYEYGQVSHALAAALRALLGEYFVLLAQLEQMFRLGKLNLQKMWFFLQPSLGTMRTLARLATDATDARAGGAALLSLLHEHAVRLAGDPPAHALLLSLLGAASQPYFSMLALWLHRGSIADPYGEFVVVEHGELRKENLAADFNDHYWDRRYTIRGGMADRRLSGSSTGSLAYADWKAPQAHVIPSFLHAHAERILITGKYLNVVREFAGAGTSGLGTGAPPTLSYSPNERLYAEHIDEAYRFASAALVRMLMVDCQLGMRLGSVKRYFLLEQGDLVPHFMEIAADELALSVARVDVSRLESLLDLAIRSTSALSDCFHEDVTLELMPYTVNEQLQRIISAGASGASGASGLASASASASASIAGAGSAMLAREAFVFDYRVSWPLSLVLSRRALSKYQQLCRHVLQLQHVAGRVRNAWLDHQTTKEYDVAHLFRKAFAVRQKMLHFLQTLQTFMTYEVFEPRHHSLLDALASASTVDEVIALHDDFLDTCLKECLLTHADLLKLITKLLTTCTVFADFTEHYASQRMASASGPIFAQALARGADSSAGEVLELRRLRSANVAEQARLTLDDGHFRSSLAKFDENFSRLMRAFLQTVAVLSANDPHLTNLFIRIDFTGYYSTALGLGMEVGASGGDPGE